MKIVGEVRSCIGKLWPGDSLNVIWNSPSGSQEIIRHEIAEAIDVDRVVVVEVANELGFERAIGAIIGKKL